MNRILVVGLITLLFAMSGSKPVATNSNSYWGKGHYMDTNGVIHKGKLWIFYPNYFMDSDTSTPTIVRFKNKEGKRYLDYKEIKSFVIKKVEYYPRTSISSRSQFLGIEREYTFHDIFVEKVIEGKISCYEHSSLISKGQFLGTNCSTTILEKDGKEYDLGSCLENKRRNLCLIEPLKDNPELYKKYKRRASYTIHSTSTIRYMYRDYNNQYK